MNRRDFLACSSAALGGGSLLAASSAPAAAADNALLRHRFGANYVPAKNW